MNYCLHRKLSSNSITQLHSLQSKERSGSHHRSKTSERLYNDAIRRHGNYQRLEIEKEKIAVELPKRTQSKSRYFSKKYLPDLPSCNFHKRYKEFLYNAKNSVKIDNNKKRKSINKDIPLLKTTSHDNYFTDITDTAINVMEANNSLINERKCIVEFKQFQCKGDDD